MSVGIVRVQKFSAGSVKGIEIHDRREKEGISHTNKDIDFNLSYKNYDLHEEQNQNFRKKIKSRISELNLKKAVRKDAVVLAQVLVTSDHDFFEKMNHLQREQFFKESYDFFCERYGKENIISSVVHLDEHTPHMHVNFIPITVDGRLSAKSILNKQSLIQQQTDFYFDVGSNFDLERGQKGSKNKHIDLNELKARTGFSSQTKNYDQVAELQQKINALNLRIRELEEEKKKYKSQQISEETISQPKSKIIDIPPLDSIQDSMQRAVNKANANKSLHQRNIKRSNEPER